MMISSNELNTIDPLGPAPANEHWDVLPNILCVDDDPNILDGFRRNLRKRFSIFTAAGAWGSHGRYSRERPIRGGRYRLPNARNGRNSIPGKGPGHRPHTARILLTGQADIAMAMAAVNKGNLFRFLLKPCTPLVLEKVLLAGCQHYRRLLSEQNMLEETLHGSVHVLAELLSVVQPEAFSRATRIRRYVEPVAEKLQLADRWQFDAAALLSHIGWITLPPPLLAKVTGSESLSPEELTALHAHTSAAARMLEKIPRLAIVASMIERQHVPYKLLANGGAIENADAGMLGAQLLKALIAYDRLRQKEVRHPDALHQMNAEAGAYMPQILEALSAVESPADNGDIVELPLFAISSGMILEEDLRSKSGLLLLGRGQEVTAMLVNRLINGSYGIPSDQLCKVRVPPDQ